MPHLKEVKHLASTGVWKALIADLWPNTNLSAWSSSITCQCRQLSSKGASGAAAAKQPSKPAAPPAPPPPLDSPPPSPAAVLKPYLTPLQSSQQRTKAAYIPWVFSRHQTPMRHVANRMGFLIEALEREQELASLASKQHLDDFTSGDVLEVRMRVPEAGGAEYSFKGVCVARYNKGIRSAFKILNSFPESGDVVQHIPLYMPDLLSVKVVGKVRKRRSKLYYMIGQDGATSYQAEPLLLAGGSGAAAPVAAAGAGKGGGKGGGGAKGGAKKGK